MSESPQLQLVSCVYQWPAETGERAAEGRSQRPVRHTFDGEEEDGGAAQSPNILQRRGDHKHYRCCSVIRSFAQLLTTSCLKPTCSQEAKRPTSTLL